MWKRIRLGWFIATLWLPPQATAQLPAELPAAWNACFHGAGIYYGVAPELLIAIARTESQLDPAARYRNRDGSWDLGVMQVNTRWLPALQSRGLTAESLYEPCMSIWVGAWVLAQSIAIHGYSWESVGAYNAGSGRGHAADRRRMEYANRVSRHLARRPVGHVGGVRHDERFAVSGIAEYSVSAGAAADASAGSDARR